MGVEFESEVMTGGQEGDSKRTIDLLSLSCPSRRRQCMKYKVECWIAQNIEIARMISLDFVISITIIVLSHLYMYRTFKTKLSDYRK